MANAGQKCISAPDASGHFVRFYHAESLLLDEVVEFADGALRSGGSAILIATRPHLSAITPRLRGFGRERDEDPWFPGKLVLLDAELALSRFMVDGWPDERRFLATIGKLIASASEKTGPVHAFGEMVSVLCEAGQYDAALRLEALWSALARRYSFTLLCAYPYARFSNAEHSQAFEHICSAHSHVLPSEVFVQTAEADTHRLIALWQQKALALESEIQRWRDAEAMLRQRERELADFVENASEGLHRAAGDGTIVWANRAELNMLGYAYDEYVGRHIADFYVERPVIDAILAKLRAGETIRDELVRLRCKDGSIKHALIQANASFENGELLHTRCFTRDASDRIRRQAAERQRDALFMNAPVAAALLTGPNHVFELANTRYRELAGCTELTGRTYAEVFPREQHSSEIANALTRAYERGESIVLEAHRIDMTRADGAFEPRYFTFHFEPLRLGGEGVEGVIVVAIDVTEQVRARARFDKSHAERERLVIELKAASRAKDEFLAMLGHELRNPLSPIVTALQLMRMRSEASTSHEQGIIQRQVDHLVRLVDDLLDISRITRGKIELKKTTVRVADVLTNAVEMASFLLEQRSHQLSVDMQPELVWEVDATRLAQVVANLLTNAARYTPVGGRIRLAARGEENGMIAVSVSDNGIGIAKDMLPRVFGLFFQGKRNLDRAEGGLGIGLALVKNLVEMHGGCVSAASAGPGLGSEFTIRVPGSARARRDIEGEDDERARAGGLERTPTPAMRRVLLVDDNVDGVQALAELLKTYGHHVEAVCDPVAALQIVRRFEPEIAVIDIGLPVMDGYELVGRLRTALAGRACLFVALTGYGQDADRNRSRASGFDHHFVKPLDPTLLLRLIEALPAR